MSALENLAAALNDVRSAVALGVEGMRQLAHDLAVARSEAADSVLIDRIAAELHSTADQLRVALAGSDENQPQA